VAISLTRARILGREETESVTPRRLDVTDAGSEVTFENSRATAPMPQRAPDEFANPSALGAFGVPLLFAT
jgi:hypothetical protein